MKFFIKLCHRLRDYVESCKDDRECCFDESSYWHILHGYALAVHEYIYERDPNTQLTHDDIQNMLEEILNLDDGDGLDEELNEIFTEYTNDNETN